MATFKVLLDKRRSLKDGTYPLVVRIYNGRKFRDISLKTYLKECHFDHIDQKVNSKHPNKKTINQLISKTILKVQETALNLEIQNEVVSAEKIKNAIVKPHYEIDFFTYGAKLIEEMEYANRYGNANYYKAALNAFSTYSGKSELQFSEITYDLLIALEGKMLSEGLKKNTIAAYHRAIRSVINRAINAELVDVKLYPYRKYKIKGEATAKRNISKDDIITISNLELEPFSPKWHSRNIFLLSFNLRGMNITDIALMKHSNIGDGRLLYQRRKTHKPYNLKLTEHAKEILAYYQSDGKTFIMPIIGEDIVDNPKKQREVIQQATKTCNKYLKRIGADLNLSQRLTTYVARHSFATIAKKMGYSKDLISEALGHSYGNRVTEIYLDSFDQEVLDDMNERVCKL